MDYANRNNLIRSLVEHHRENRSLIVMAMVTTVVVIALIAFLKFVNVNLSPETDFYDIPIPDASAVVEKEIEPQTDWLHIKVKSGDNLSNIFAKAGLPASSIFKILKLGKAVQPLTRLHPGQQLKILSDNAHQLEELVLNLSAEQLLIIKNIDGNYSAERKKIVLEPRQHFASGIIDSSLFVATRKAGLSSKLARKLVEIFSAEVDFKHDLRRGDSFTVLYNDYYSEDKKIEAGDIIAAEIITHGKEHNAIRFSDSAGNVGYYDGDGHSVRRAYLRAPLHYSRISSPFNLHRQHPILHVTRPHRGVDLAAPAGTPIHAASAGRVAFRGRKHGYGRLVEIRHNSKYSTRYAHMSRFNKHVKRGTRVKRGDVIGYVGQSGLATAPHLHYEFRVNGKARNPLRVHLPHAHAVLKKYRQKFNKVSTKLIEKLHLYAKSDKPADFT